MGYHLGREMIRTYNHVGIKFPNEGEQLFTQARGDCGDQVRYRGFPIRRFIKGAENPGSVFGHQLITIAAKDIRQLVDFFEGIHQTDIVAWIL